MPLSVHRRVKAVTVDQFSAVVAGESQKHQETSVDDQQKNGKEFLQNLGKAAAEPHIESKHCGKDAETQHGSFGRFVVTIEIPQNVGTQRSFGNHFSGGFPGLQGGPQPESAEENDHQARGQKKFLFRRNDNAQEKKDKRRRQDSERQMNE